MKHAAAILAAVLAGAVAGGCAGVPTKARLIPIAGGDGAAVALDMGARAVEEGPVLTVVRKHPILSALGGVGLGFLGNFIYQELSSDDDDRSGGGMPAQPSSVGDGNIFVTGSAGGDIEVTVNSAAP